MSAPARPPYDRWRDDRGVHIADGARVEQIAVSRDLGALRCRMHRCGEVIGRTRSNRLLVLFDGEPRPVSIRPHLVRVVPLVLTAEQVIEQGCASHPAPHWVDCATDSRLHLVVATFAACGRRLLVPGQQRTTAGGVCLSCLAELTARAAMNER